MSLSLLVNYKHFMTALTKSPKVWTAQLDKNLWEAMTFVNLNKPNTVWGKTSKRISDKQWFFVNLNKSNIVWGKTSKDEQVVRAWTFLSPELWQHGSHARSDLTVCNLSVHWQSFLSTHYVELHSKIKACWKCWVVVSPSTSGQGSGLRWSGAAFATHAYLPPSGVSLPPPAAAAVARLWWSFSCRQS